MQTKNYLYMDTNAQGNEHDHLMISGLAIAYGFVSEYRRITFAGQVRALIDDVVSGRRPSCARIVIAKDDGQLFRLSFDWNDDHTMVSVHVHLDVAEAR